MKGFVDVNPTDWFFRDIVELQDVGDGSFFLGIDYNQFETGYAAIDITLPDIVVTASEFTVDAVIIESDKNPLIIFVDGVLTGYDSISTNIPSAGKTTIKLKRYVNPGSKVRFITYGIPLMQTSDRTEPEVLSPDGVSYPNKQLSIDSGWDYYSDPMYGKYPEVILFNGKQLRKVTFNQSKIDNWSLFSTELDYSISPSGVLYTNFNLRNEQLYANFLVKDGSGNIKQVTDVITVEATNIIHKNRFFPEVLIKRSEAISCFNRLRIEIFEKYSDVPVYRSTKSTSRFLDVQAVIDDCVSNNTQFPWWWEHVRDLEELKMVDGSYVISGYLDGNLYLDEMMTRAQATVLINRFKDWFVDCLK